MKILTIHLRNLNSLRGDTMIDLQQPPLSETGLFAITGPTGSGKTTLLDAITLALYGQMHRNKRAEEGMAHGTGECMASVEFEAKGKKYLAKWMIHRAYKRPDGKLQAPIRELGVWNTEKEDYELIVDKVSEANTAIEEITGLNYDRFTRSVLLAQGDFAAFLDADDRDRSDILEQITGTEQYTRISRLAYQRHKQEQQNLQTLHSQRGEIQVLDADTRTAHEVSLNNLQLGVLEKEKELANSEADLQWLQACREWESRIAEEEEKLGQVKQEKADAAESLDRLQRHLQTRPFRSQLTQYDQWLDDAQTLQAQLDELGTDLQDVTEKKQKAEEALEALTQKSLEQEMELEKQEPLFNQVARLDVRIKERDGQLAELKKALQAQQARVGQLEKKIRESEEFLKAKTGELEQAEEDLSQYPESEALGTALGRLTTLLDRFEQESAELDAMAQRKKQSAAQIKELETGRSALEKEVANENNEFARLLAEFKAATPAGLGEDRRSILEQLHAQMLAMSEQAAHIRDLSQAIESYQELLRQEQELLTEIETRQSEEFAIQKALLTDQDLLAQLQDQEDYYRKIYEQQQLIANFDKARQELQPGEPCPLCQSTDHPFRQHGVPVYEDRAEEDWKRWKKKREQHVETYRERQKDSYAVFSLIVQLRGPDADSVGGRLGNLRSLLEKAERTIAAAQLELINLHPPTHSVAAFSEWEKNWQAKRRALAEQQKTLGTMNQELENCEAALHQKTGEFREKTQVLDLERRRLEDLENRHQDQLRQKERTENEMLQTFQAFRIDAPDRPYRETIEELQSTYDRQIELARQARQIKESILTGTEKLASQRESIAAAQADLEEKGQQVADQQAALDELRAARNELFGDREPEAERSKARQAVQDIRRQVDSQRTVVGHLRTEHSNKQTLLEKTRTDLANKTQAAETLAAQLRPKAQKAGFEKLTEARQALLSPEEESRLESLRKGLDEREAGHRQALQTARKSLAARLEEKRTDKSAETLRNEIGMLKGDLQSDAQEIGRVSQVLAEDQKLRTRHRKLGEAIERQHRELARWARLNDLIGSADGKKFRVFAQGLTLKTLVRLANRHLQSLNERYRIQRRPGQELELDIIDTFQADNIRSMKTLSGGERFLVSLALALGLSDLSGERNNIRSLFIDEGFGTLDKETLDLALETLENLRDAGKTIGIISHVEELKERIAVQVQLKRIGNGLSQIRVVGA